MKKDKTVDRFWNACKNEVRQRNDAATKKRKIDLQQRREEVREIIYRKDHGLPV